MARWLGIVAASDKIILVDAVVPPEGPITVQMDHTWRLQEGDRPAAYAVIQQQLTDYIKEQGIEQVVVKESTVSLGGTKKSHLQAAELRGVVLAAASTVPVIQLAKGRISKNFGERKADEYLRDDAFWEENAGGGRLRTGSREAAILLLMARTL